MALVTSLPSQKYLMLSISLITLTLSWVYTETGLTEEMKSLSVHLQYLVAAALETSQIQIFTPSGYTMGMTNWSIHQLRLFWQYTAIVRRQAVQTI